MDISFTLEGLDVVQRLGQLSPEMRAELATRFDEDAGAPEPSRDDAWTRPHDSGIRRGRRWRGTGRLTHAQYDDLLQVQESHRNGTRAALFIPDESKIIRIVHGSEIWHAHHVRLGPSELAERYAQPVDGRVLAVCVLETASPIEVIR
jgi:hypothetical protein